MPDRGTSYSQIFRSMSLSTSGTGVLIIVDECANAIRMDPNGLYNILRAGELYGITLGVILVSVDDPLIYMSERERKTLGLFSGMKFSKYSDEELYSILMQRVYERSTSLFELYRREVMDLPFIYRTTKKLQTLGIIEGRITGKGDRKGVEKRLTLSDVPVTILADKIRQILDRL